MKYKATIDVNLKPDYTDPEGETTAKTLKNLGYEVSDIRVGKRHEIFFEAPNREKAEEIVEEMCRRQLSNPTKDNYDFKIEEIIKE